MERSPVRDLLADFDFSIEPDTPQARTPPTIKRDPVPRNTHEYAYPSDKYVYMAHYKVYKTAHGRKVTVEYKPLKWQAWQ
jgi:hypothetical protein